MNFSFDKFTLVMVQVKIPPFCEVFVICVAHMVGQVLMKAEGSDKEGLGVSCFLMLLK